MSEESELPREEIDAALGKASDEIGLATYYRDCVRPLLRQPREQWPRCCGGGCEPCTQTLILVAERVEQLLEEARKTSSYALTGI